MQTIAGQPRPKWAGGSGCWVARKLTTPTNHTVTVINRFGNSITAPVVYLKSLADGQRNKQRQATPVSVENVSK